MERAREGGRKVGSGTGLIYMVMVEWGNGRENEKESPDKQEAASPKTREGGGEEGPGGAGGKPHPRALPHRPREGDGRGCPAAATRFCT